MQEGMCGMVVAIIFMNYVSFAVIVMIQVWNTCINYHVLIHIDIMIKMSEVLLIKLKWSNPSWWIGFGME